MASQGAAPGELFSVLRGIRGGVVYANVHTDIFPGGEIRGHLIFAPSQRTGSRAEHGHGAAAGP